jgi:hypothetical protein
LALEKAKELEIAANKTVDQEEAERLRQEAASLR